MTYKKGPGPYRDIYQEVTDKLLEALEAGTKPWVRPWDSSKCGGAMAPMNPTTGKLYRGINVILLGMSPLAFYSGDPRWSTYQQANDKGWQVKKGEKSTSIIFYKPLVKAGEGEATGEDRPTERLIPMLRAYSVFHASQIEGIPAYDPPALPSADWTAIEAVETIIANSRATVRIGGDRAFYSPSTDHIQLPPDAAFTGAYECAATKLHELNHWTGATGRVERPLLNGRNSHAYAFEELVAEIGSALEGSQLGLTCDIPNHASYLSGYVDCLKADKRAIFRAASLAQKVADFVLAYHPDFAPEPAETLVGIAPLPCRPAPRQVQP